MSAVDYLPCVLCGDTLEVEDEGRVVTCPWCIPTDVPEVPAQVRERLLATLADEQAEYLSTAAERRASDSEARAAREKRRQAVIGHVMTVVGFVVSLTILAGIFGLLP